MLINKSTILTPSSVLKTLLCISLTCLCVVVTGLSALIPVASLIKLTSMLLYLIEASLGVDTVLAENEDARNSFGFEKYLIY